MPFALLSKTVNKKGNENKFGDNLYISMRTFIAQ